MTESGIGYRADNTVLSPNTFLPLFNANYINFKNRLDAGDNMVQSICLSCGKEFCVKSGTLGKYCSLDCYWQSMRTRSQANCIICGNEFTKQRESSRCCSRKCRKEYFKRKNTKTCPVCGNSFVSTHPEVKTCSKKCGNILHRKQVDNICLYCGNVFQTTPSETRKFCSQLCGVKYNSPWTREQEELLVKYYPTKQYAELEKITDQSRKAIEHKICTKHPQLKKHKPSVVINCTQCGKKIKRYQSFLSSGKWGNFCSKKCRGNWISENIIGENHPSWKGGYYPYFGKNWGKVRRMLREQNLLVCILCGIQEEELDTELHAHHLKPRREFEKVEDSNTLDNLILLCNKCHKKVENYANRNMPPLRQTETPTELLIGNAESVSASVFSGNQSIGCRNEEPHTYVNKLKSCLS